MAVRIRNVQNVPFLNNKFCFIETVNCWGYLDAAQVTV